MAKKREKGEEGGAEEIDLDESDAGDPDAIDEDIAERISAFQGHRLQHVRGVAAAAPTALMDTGITDAEQLIAVAAIPESRRFLSTQMGWSDQELSSAVAEARKVVSAPVLTTIEHPVTQLYGLGARPPTAEMIARAAALTPVTAVAEPVALPQSVNLISRMSPIRNQASRGTCVAFTITAINEYYRRATGRPRNLSEQHLYYETKLTDGSPGLCGTWQAAAAQALSRRGQCRENIWAYNPNPPCNNHGARPATARQNALNYRLRLQQLPSNSVNGLKAALAARRPGGISIPVYNSWYQSAETERTGRITLRLGNEPNQGGHAVCVVGYQDDPGAPGGGYFIIRNSWHTTWGYQCPYGAGYGTIPYRYITNDCWEIFVLASPVTGDEDDDDAQEQEQQDEETRPPKPDADDGGGGRRRTVTVTIKGDVNLVLG